MANIVYIATSLDGFISDRNDELDWLHAIPNPEDLDFGYAVFMERIDAIVMGRKTFETVCGFDFWPYQKPVFVLSNSLSSLAQEYEGRAELISGALPKIIASLHARGLKNLYIDGGVTVQNFLAEDLIDEMTITVLPTLLGAGSPLFGALSEPLDFELIHSEVLLNALVQNHYRRKKSADE